MFFKTMVKLLIILFFKFYFYFLEFFKIKIMDLYNIIHLYMCNFYTDKFKLFDFSLTEFCPSCDAKGFSLYNNKVGLSIFIGLYCPS